MGVEAAWRRVPSEERRGKGRDGSWGGKEARRKGEQPLRRRRGAGQIWEEGPEVPE